MKPEFPFLSSAEAKQILNQVGKNELPQSSRSHFFHSLIEIIREPMILILFLCSTIYLFIGQLHEALLLIASVLVATLISVMQQFKSEKALESLKSLSSPRASVVRDGIEMRIAGADIVPKDIIIVREGDRVPADAQLLKADQLEIDESPLTGESLPMQKNISSHIFSGTLVVSGHGTAQVFATGIKTEFGKIGKAIETIKKDHKTAFQVQTTSFVKRIGIVAIIFCIVVILIYGWRMKDWPNAFLAGLSIAMSILPEEMPIVVTLFLVLGAWRISKYSVLTRRMSAIENLGATTVLCVDKTGTLTENKMVLKTLWSDNKIFTEEHILKTAFAANHSTPFDPMEKAIESAFQAKNTSSDFLTSFQNLKRVKEYTLSKELPAVSSVWKNSTKNDSWVAAKGAPETIVSLCKLDPSLSERILSQAKLFAKKGQRVLGVADCVYNKTELPQNQKDFPLNFIGLVGFEDPIRKEVPQALTHCYDAGIRVIIMTGDHPGTAQAIAESIGLSHPEVQILGQQLDLMSDEELTKQITNTNVFARLKPEQKLRLVKALQAQGELVSMTGDGINDAPALKAADIGIAMGSKGTDVAREASDIVLMDDNFASIVNAIRLGRRIFENVRNAISYIMAIHFPIAGLALIPVLLKMPLVLLPPQIVLLEFMIDPACSFVFEAEAEDLNIMKRKPRNRWDNLFGKEEYFWNSLQGAIVLTVVFGTYWWALQSDRDTAHARSLAFTSLIFGNLALIFVNRSHSARILTLLNRENRLFHYVVLGVAVVLSLILVTPSLKNFFTFGHLEIADLGLSFSLGLIIIFLTQILKAIRLSLT